MYRIFIVFSIGTMFFSFLGCGKFVESVIGTDKWSENYALMDGVTATSPEMIDGDVKTSGQTTFPEGADVFMYGTSPPSEAIITLPKRMSIYRVVINSPNLVTFDIFVDKGDNDWEIVKENQKVTKNPVDVRLSANTDKIRIRVRTTTDDAEVGRQSRARSWRGSRGGRQRAPATINEIELYGFATSGTEVSAEEAAEEEELDKLLTQ
ncbi:TPA: hypothetical protein EYP66_10155 [Candidatus Poribacteria bacterium]|nr:hypothetical protein [Candidatus Poribacteria bacterium]